MRAHDCAEPQSKQIASGHTRPSVPRRAALRCAHRLHGSASLASSPGSAPLERPASPVPAGQLRTATSPAPLAHARFTAYVTLVVCSSRHPAKPGPGGYHIQQRAIGCCRSNPPPLRTVPACLAASSRWQVLHFFRGSAAGPSALAPLASCPAPHRWSLRPFLSQPLRGPLRPGLRLPFSSWRLRRVSGSARAASGPPLPPPPPLGSALTASLLASLVVPLASPLSLWSRSRADCVSRTR
jgi:hypothetical protein